MTNKIPHSSNVCPRCMTPSIEVTPLSQAAYKKPVDKAYCFTTTECSSCQIQFGSDQLLQEQIKHRAQTFGVSDKIIDEEIMKCYIASQLPLPIPVEEDNLSSLIFGRALLTYQHICCMFFPKERQYSPSTTDDGRVLLERPPGHEYINGYSPSIAALLKMNHDIKLLAAGEGRLLCQRPTLVYCFSRLVIHLGPEKSHYMLKYTTKDQKISKPSANSSART